jgi:hypothetical protein
MQATDWQGKNHCLAAPLTLKAGISQPSISPEALRHRLSRDFAKFIKLMINPTSRKCKFRAGCFTAF